MIDKIRELPEGVTAEDTMRLLVNEDGELFSAPAVKVTMARLLKLLEEDPEIDVSRICVSMVATSSGRCRALFSRACCSRG